MVAGLRQAGVVVHALRDPTRGGVAQSCIEIARSASATVVLEQGALPIAPPVLAACELTGIDPLHVANEGKLLAFVPAKQANDALAVLRAHRLGAQAVVIGKVETGPADLLLETELGARRPVRMPSGELLPRIC